MKNKANMNKLKEIANNLLPHSSILRTAINAEPDIVPRDIVVAKIEIFSRLLYEEISIGDTTINLRRGKNNGPSKKK